MGKSPKPLSFLVHPSLVRDDDGSRQTLVDLEAQGHEIHFMDADGDDYDIKIGPNCWRAFDLKYLDLAIKSARATKFLPGEKKAKTVKKTTRKPRKVKDAENYEG